MWRNSLSIYKRKMQMKLLVVWFVSVVHCRCRCRCCHHQVGHSHPHRKCLLICKPFSFFAHLHKIQTSYTQHTVGWFLFVSFSIRFHHFYNGQFIIAIEIKSQINRHFGCWCSCRWRSQCACARVRLIASLEL